MKKGLGLRTRILSLRSARTAIERELRGRGGSEASAKLSPLVD